MQGTPLMVMKFVANPSGSPVDRTATLANRTSPVRYQLFLKLIESSACPYCTNSIRVPTERKVTVLNTLIESRFRLIHYLPRHAMEMHRKSFLKRSPS